MKKFLLAYLVSVVLLAVVLFIHYVELLKAVLGEAYGEIVWRGEVLVLAFFRPFLGVLLLQTLLFFGGYLIVINVLKKRRVSDVRYWMGALVLTSMLGAALFLGLFEPILASDSFEYGTRQELNRIFELVGYTRINVTVYGYLALTAILTWVFVRKETNKAIAKSTVPTDTGDLLDN